MTEINKILVANRGEIAIRVMRTANELGRRTVAVFAEEDKLSLHRFKSDESYRIGDGLGPIEAYLSIPEIIRVAKQSGADAIHPGYGLLSENPELVEACADAGIIFIGPSAETMRKVGDKASARQVAIDAGVPVVPASGVLSDDPDQIKAAADEVGYPLMLKASWGGGGRGMRMIHNPEELLDKVAEGRREAEAAFGNGEGFLEKLVTSARHVEVQILGDSHGEVYHLWERDCTVQRRNQKVVERAPAPYLTDEQRTEICSRALKIAKAVGYQGAGTVEFLMDVETSEFYFIEVNPRIQVEHTVTEEITGIDIVHAQILIAEGKTLAAATGVACQDDVALSGHAIQCRITTEDPSNNFIPDYGKIAAYRVATGMGIRLDGGTAYSGAVITRHYDSLLEKVTAWAPKPELAIARLERALREFRIRGVSTNISFVENLLHHPAFLDNSYTTRFIDNTPELFRFPERQDRASRLLRYIADITVNGHPETIGRPEPRVLAVPDTPALRVDEPRAGTKQILDERGPEGLSEWIKDQKGLLITDTSMRDAHQSLLATRMRTRDLGRIAPVYAANMPELFSIECWGGATFDVAYRFLQESPWQRLSELREAMPNILTQMLLRASNGVGYTNYPDNVVKYFVDQAAEQGIDVFRIFDSLNWVENMDVAIQAVRDTGKVAEAAICYTGDLFEPDTMYNLDYYVEMAKKLADSGAHIIGVKDMAGLMKPAAARALFPALADSTGLPLHFHTHDTSGISSATILAASDSGCDIVDVAMDALAGTTSQPPLGSIVAALHGRERDTGLNLDAIREISIYFEQVRGGYAAFESGLSSPASEVYLHEMPGGQFTNLKTQARSLGLEERWPEVARAYRAVNDLLGDIPKVTPSSKVVGDLALMMVAQDITPDDVLDPEYDVAWPDSMVAMMQGYLGQPPSGRWPERLQRKVLGNQESFTDRPGARMAPVDLDGIRDEVDGKVKGEIIDRDVASYLMYPKVFLTYRKRKAEYGPVWSLPTHTFFYGMGPGEEISVSIEPGKTLEIRCLTVSETDDEGMGKVFFELNGQPRMVRVPDRSVVATAPVRQKADPDDASHIGAPMPGVVSTLGVAEGDEVSKGTLLMTLEAMKMETGIPSPFDGVVSKLHVAPADAVDAKDLLIEVTPA